MAMQLSSSTTVQPEVMLEVNTTPLIDVMLVLIIMLIITIPIQNHSLSLNLPNRHTDHLPKVVHKIDVDFDGSLMWNGELINDEQLAKNLGVALSSAESPEVQIRPHKQVDYKNVARVMALAQRLGVTKIGMVGNEQFLN